MVDRDVDGELEDLRRGIERAIDGMRAEQVRYAGNLQAQGTIETCIRKLRAECGWFPAAQLPKVGDWVRITDTEHSCYDRVMRVVGSDPKRIGQLIELDDGDGLVVRAMPGMYEPVSGPLG